MREKIAPLEETQAEETIIRVPMLVKHVLDVEFDRNEIARVIREIMIGTAGHNIADVIQNAGSLTDETGAPELFYKLQRVSWNEIIDRLGAEGKLPAILAFLGEDEDYEVPEGGWFSDGQPTSWWANDLGMELEVPSFAEAVNGWAKAVTNRYEAEKEENYE